MYSIVFRGISECNSESKSRVLHFLTDYTDFFVGQLLIDGILGTLVIFLVLELLICITAMLFGLTVLAAGETRVSTQVFSNNFSFVCSFPKPFIRTSLPFPKKEKQGYVSSMKLYCLLLFSQGLPFFYNFILIFTEHTALVVFSVCRSYDIADIDRQTNPAYEPTDYNQYYIL